MRPEGKLNALDALRGLLAMTVCIAHSWQVFVHPAETEDTAAGLGLGVAARLAVIGFFCLSGFVIAMSVARNRERHGTFGLVDYALARAFRILPPLAFALLATLLLAAALHAAGLEVITAKQAARPAYVVLWRDQVACLATLCVAGDLTGGLNGPLWSLAYEIQLYVLAGLLVVAARGGSARPSRLACAVAVVIIALALWIEERPGWGWLHLLSFAAFGFGWAASGARGRIPDQVFAALAAAGLAVATIALVAGRQGFFAEFDRPSLLLLSQLVFSASIASALPIIARWRARPLLASTGGFSYTLYILHGPILLFGFVIFAYVVPDYSLAAGWTAALVGAAAVVMLARLIARYLERPAEQRAAVEQLQVSLTAFRREI
jgi:peptidoglycan/LPS O-acetylase OafA/YrhL